MKELAERLKLLRAERGYTQKFLHENIHVSLRNYQDYEYAKVIPTATVLIALAKLYHVSIDYILGLTDDPTCHW